ncbi:MAG: lytic murein transglycosylase B [Pseudomonadota bacterium]|nr:lytic murein transglycosylase B [Pseudomonadota bacterium]
MIRRALVCLLPLALAACATQAPPPVPPVATPAPAPPPKPVPPPSVMPTPVGELAIARADFARETAAKYGLDARMIEATLARAQIRDGIITAMSRPAEGKPWRDYRPIFITPARIDGGRAFLATHRDALARAEAKYGVPAELIVAIIGVETSYGGNKGSYPVVDALYTLAFRYPRTNEPAKVPRENAREAFFRDELGQVFVLGREANMDIAALQGSYAGAMGWGQFMPSSYRQYAVDGDGDGRRDLINDLDDVFPSIANYFIGRGKWQRGGPVMVRAMRDASAAEFNAETIDPVHTVAALAAKGYRPSQPVAANEMATVIKLDGVNGPEYWMVFRNFQAITKYNSSRLYATAVHQLSQAIAGRDVPGA